MANTVIALKKSATPAAAPTSLANGELAINYADGILYYKAANGVIASIQSLEGNSFGTVNANGTLLVSDTVGDILTVVSGNNISIVGDAINDRLTIRLADDVVIPSTGTFKVSAVGNDEGGEIKLGNAITNSVLTGDVIIDIFQNRLRFFESGGTNRGAFINIASASAGVGTDLLASSSATDTAARTTANAAFLHANAAFSVANAALPNVSGVSFNGNLTVSQNLSADRIFSTNNGLGENFKVGDDAWIGDTNLANAVRLKGQQNASIGYIMFGPNDGKLLGRAGTDNLTYDGNTVWHAGTDGAGSGLDADLLDGQHGSYYGIATDVTAVFARANIAFANANTVMISAQSAFTQANIAYAHANTAHASANAGQATGNAAFGQANTATALATAAQSIANLAFIHANNAYATVNSAFAVANAALPNTSGVTFNGNLNVSQNVSADKFIATNNGNSENFRVGDDAWIGDFNVSNSIKIKGVQNSQIAYISFGTGDAKALGRDGTNNLTYDGNTVWHAGTDGAGSGLDADLLDGQHGSYYGIATDVTAANRVANAAFLHANSGYAFANSISLTANAAFLHANAAFANGNTVIQTAQSAFNQANISFLHANAAFASANAGQASGNAAQATANASYAFGNSAHSIANLAFTHANAAFASSNSVNTYSNSTYVKLVAASQTITGNLAVTGSLTVSGNAYTIDSQTLKVSDPLIYLAGNNYVSDIVDIGFVANYVNATGSNVHTGLFRDATIKEYYLFEGYDKEPEPNHIDTAGNNFTISVLNATIKTSNLILGGANAILTIGASFNHANAAHASANAGMAIGNGAFASANAGQATANAAFNRANTANITADRAWNHANAAFATVNSAFGVANTALPNTSGVSFVGTLNFTTGNVLIGRTDSTIGAGVRLDINGAANASNLLVNGNMVFTAANDGAGSNLDADLLDGQQGTYYGIATDVTAANRVANAAFLHANAVYAYANADSAFSNSAHSIANLAFTHANNAYAKANSALANTAGISTAGALIVPGILTANAGQNGFQMRAGGTADHVYIEYYPRSATGSRGAYVGYGSAGTNTFSFINETTTGSLELGTAGAADLAIDSAGNVGIGRTNPGFKLDVVGTANASNILVNGNMVFTAANDGSGSNLDADLLDGQQGTYYGIATDVTAANRVANAAFLHANAAFATVNSAFGVANTALANTAGITTAGSIIVAGNVSLTWPGSTARRIGTFFDNGYRSGMYFGQDTRTLTIFSTSADSAGHITFNTRLGAGSSDEDYGTERARITNTGNTLIGRTADSTVGAGVRLDINGAANASNLLVNGNMVFTAANDGAGSNLDADLLDGQQGSYYGIATDVTAANRVANAAFLHANAVYAYANADYAFSNSAHSIANLAFTHANNAYIAANTARTVVNDTVNATRYLMFANGTSGTSSLNVAVGLAFTPSSNTLNINGALNAVTKSFVIPHPVNEGMFLRYGSLEGPENGVYVRGKIEGKSIIELPEYWWNLIDQDTITVNLTPYGRSQDIWVQSTCAHFIHLNQPADCFFTVFAERKDVDKLVVEY